MFVLGGAPLEAQVTPRLASVPVQPASRGELRYCLKVVDELLNLCYFPSAMHRAGVSGLSLIVGRRAGKQASMCALGMGGSECHAERRRDKIDERSDDSSREVPLAGTVTASGLNPGSTYTIYRWDSVAEAFDYSKATLVRRRSLGKVGGTIVQGRYLSTHAPCV